ncbi:phosphoribosylglycinamide formyltransferase [Antarcticibacterium arcticum]|uniref:Phosphoribosylglycinamide formyltransferase n=1 Tax=Antarcticibacterium arcticum TaxID=2585771 RepID=A0A5B8YLE8_9FLAO|nr:phosphoribosylglycinamide formyltransferase [Antarcticibacterium arcticum]QED38381.1 phosphoribosylglycinamide formyltransferase [Antarcticibacterium arcticum]
MNSSNPISPKKLVIFASGSGTNAENIIKYFKNSGTAEVVAVLSNNKGAKVLKRAYDLDVKALHFDRDAFYNTQEVHHVLKDMKPDLIILAGFLWLFPENILKSFPNKVINLHPALLPKFGGKGMYGEAVHKAVLEHKEKETGITIHYVNPKYDEGNIIFQDSFEINPEMTHMDIATRIHELEYRHLPVVIENLLNSQV